MTHVNVDGATRAGPASGSIPAIWRGGGVAVGAWCAVPSALSVEALAAAGFDWLCVDMQHGCMDYSGALEMIRAIEAAGAQPIVRVPWNEPGIIGRVLDAGATGVIIPMIQSAADARAAVEACLYPPSGRRSFGPFRVGLRQGNAYFEDANRRILVIPMIETAEALVEVDEIAATPGVGALFLGPYDMSIALGLPPRDNDGEPAFDAAISAIVSAARGAGIGAAVLSSAALYAIRAGQGFNMISTTIDLRALSTAAREDLESVRNASA